MDYTICCSEMYFDEVFSKGNLIDLRDVEQTSCYCGEDAQIALRQRLSSVSVNAVHWIDSGDYHYLSLFFAERIREPFSLVLLDHHPDNQSGVFDAGMLSCGNWVNFVEKISFYRPLSENIPVYLSIDLDILCPCEFRTNWDQGTLSGDDLMLEISRIAATHRILGVDVCGGLTIQKGARPSDLALNRKFRERLSGCLSQLGI